VNVTEVLMRAGRFTLPFTSSIPSSILRELREAVAWTGDLSNWGTADGHIVVTTTRIPAASVSLSSGIYTGRLTEYTDGPAVGGPGLASWLGSDGYTAEWSAGSLTATQNLSDWLDDLLFIGVRNGITKGTVTEPGGTVTATWTAMTPIEMIQYLSSMFDSEWRINPDASIDAAVASTLFTSTPTVMVTREPEGETGGISGVTGRVVNLQIDVSQLVKRAIVFPKDATIIDAVSVSSGLDAAWGPNGERVALEVPVDAMNETINATAAGNRVLDAFKHPRYQFAVDVTSDRIRQKLEPGDNIYVYDPDAGIEDRSTFQPFRGVDTFPVTVRVRGISWNVTDGHGVYLIRNTGTGNTVTDLTEWVDWPEPGARLEIGSTQGARDQSLLVTGNRYTTPIFRRITGQ